MIQQAFDILGIETTKDKRAIKKAYALLVKQYHPEEQPEEWEKIYQAYQTALEYALKTDEIPVEEYKSEKYGRAEWIPKDLARSEGDAAEEEMSTDSTGNGSLEEMFTDSAGNGSLEEMFTDSAGNGSVEEGFSGSADGESTEDTRPEDNASNANSAMDKTGSISPDAAYGDFFQEAQEQWDQKKAQHVRNIQDRLAELPRLRGKKAIKEWQHFFETDFTVNEGEGTLLLLLEAVRKDQFSEEVLSLILQTMNPRLKVYVEMGDNSRGIAAMEIVKYCNWRIPQLHEKAVERRKWIGIPAVLAAAFLLIIIIGQQTKPVNGRDVSTITAEYLNEKYDISDYTSADLVSEEVRIIGNNENTMSSYVVRERESMDVIAYAMQDTEADEAAFACFDNMQEAEIKEALEEKMNALTGHEEGRLFWNSSISDSMSGGLENGFFQTKYDGDFDTFIRQETEARANAPGVLTSFLISDYCPMNGLCDYYLPDPTVQTMDERFALTNDTEDSELQALLQQAAADYQIQIRGVVLPEVFFQKKMERAAENESGIYVMKEVRGTLGMEPSTPFLMLTGWYVNLSPEEEKILNITSGMYLQPVVSMGEGIYGAESSIKGQGTETDLSEMAGCMVRTENPASLLLTKEEEEKAVSFRLADGYVLENDWWLAIDKELYGIADTDYQVMVTKQKGFSMNVADKQLEVADDTALEEYVSSYEGMDTAPGMWDALDGEGYLFLEYEAAENADEADIITIINTH